MTTAVDLLVFGGEIEPMNDASPAPEAVAIAGDRYVAAGRRADLERLAGPGTRRLDLEGQTLLPSFCDTHMHLEKIARELEMATPAGARSMDEILERLEQLAASTPAGEWLQVLGEDNAWSEGIVPSDVLPTQPELDRTAPRHPLYLLLESDRAGLNSLAVQRLEPILASLPASSWDPESGRIFGPAAGEIQRQLPRPGRAWQLELLERAGLTLLRLGITGIVDPGLPGTFDESWALYRLARPRLRQRVRLMNRLDHDAPFDEELERVLGGSVKPHGGDDFLRAHAIKLILDGEFANAWLRDGDGACVAEPAIRYTTREIDAVLSLCGSNAWPVCVHAMGGAAIDFLLDRVEAAIRGGARFRPWQVSIAHAFLPSLADLLRCRRLGVALSVHPLLAYVYESELKEAWGPLAEQANPLRTMLGLGVLAAGGSDVVPCEPLRGAAVAVTRRSRHGSVLGPGESIGKRDALRLFMEPAWRYAGRQDIGLIVPGQIADAAVWPENPLRCSPDDWPELRAEIVLVRGQIVLAPDIASTQTSREERR